MTLSPGRWLAIGAAVTLLIMGILYLGVISPAQSRQSSAHTQLQGVQTAIGADRTQLTRLEALAATQPAQLQQAFRLNKAIPIGPQTPGIILELQRLAAESNVALSDFRTISTTPVNTLTSTNYEVSVVGGFFDVDDFMYRIHRQVIMSSSGHLTINGRLFAVTGVQLTLASATSGGPSSSDPNSVAATLQVLAFSQGSTSTSSTSSSSTTGGSSSTPSTTSTPTSQGGLG